MVRIFDLKAGPVTAVLEGHKEPVSSLAWASPTRLRTGSWDGTVRQWELGGLEQPAAAWGRRWPRPGPEGFGPIGL